MAMTTTKTTTLPVPKKTPTLNKEFRVPIINGVTIHDGAILWVVKSLLEDIFSKFLKVSSESVHNGWKDMIDIFTVGEPFL